DGCVALFRGASEAERQAVADVACRWLKAQSGQRLLPNLDYNQSRIAAEVAVLAACPLAQLKKLGARAMPWNELAYAVLADRRPGWLAEWAVMVLDENPRRFEVVHRLVREGLCPP